MPLVKGDKIYLLGFSNIESAYLKRVISHAKFTGDGSNASLWIVNQLSADSIAEMVAPSIRCLCFIGPGTFLAGWKKWLNCDFSELSEYALIPANKPRVLLPIKRLDWILDSLSLHRPGRGLARLGVKLTKILAMVGFITPLKKRVLFIATKFNKIDPQGLKQTGLSVKEIGCPKSFAIYFGLPSDDRKTVILPIGGKISSILKQGITPEARIAIRNEAKALEYLSETKLHSLVPTLLNVVETNDSITLIQEYRPRLNLPSKKIHREVVSFLTQLSFEKREHKSLNDVLHNLLCQFPDVVEKPDSKVYSGLLKRLQKLALAGTMVLGHQSHGDFAPWNFSWTRKGFFVYDWEKSQAWDIAFADAFYYTIAPTLYINDVKIPPQNALTSLFAIADKIKIETNLKNCNIYLYVSLWLIYQKGLDRNNKHSILDEMLYLLSIKSKFDHYNHSE